tara:strand:+ start:70 stop:879 length:810 start_codon:yes stop_codon:yes gene_type:complete
MSEIGGRDEFKELRGGPVGQRVMEQMSEDPSTFLVADVLRDLAYWVLREGTLTLAFVSVVSLEELFRLFKLEDLRLLELTLEYFINAIDETVGMSGSWSDDWSIQAGLVHYELQVSLEKAEMVKSFEMSVNREAGRPAQLSENVVRQIENILADEASSGKASSLPLCSECKIQVTSQDGAVMFFGGDGIEEDLSGQEGSDDYCVGFFHWSCRPSDGHHEISLERLSSSGDGLFWTLRYQEYPWFIKSNWRTLMNSMFDTESRGGSFGEQ